MEDLVPLGHRVAVGEPEDGARDREIQDVFLWRSACRWMPSGRSRLRWPSLAAVAVPDLLRLFAGEVPAVAATLLNSSTA